jgi:hypothetical protein
VLGGRGRGWCWRRGSDACPQLLHNTALRPLLRFFHRPRRGSLAKALGPTTHLVCLPSNNFSSRTGSFSQLRRNLAFIVSRLRIVTHPHSRNALTFHHNARPAEKHVAFGPYTREQRVDFCVLEAKHFRRLPALQPQSVLTSHITSPPRDTTMAGENGRTTPPAEGASPAAVENKEDATKGAAADAQKEAPAAETKAAAEPGAEPAPAPAPAAAEATEESSDKATEGKQRTQSRELHPAACASTMPLLLTLGFPSLSSIRRETRRTSRGEARRRDEGRRRSNRACAASCRRC